MPIEFEFPLVPEPSEQVLNERQSTDYREHRRNLFSWALTMGKDTDRIKGYSAATIKNRSYRIDQFYRWVWGQEAGYTTSVTHEHAENWVEELAYSTTSGAHKNNCLKSLQMLFKWRHYKFGDSLWKPDRLFETASRQPRDYLTRQERRKIREASLEYGSIPGYNDLTPDQRTRWKAYLAQRFGKPKSEVVPSDWDRANGWKIPSLVMVSLDAGLRPIEVERARTGWVDLENCVLRIPDEDAAKSRDNWKVALSDRTVSSLDRWLKQRESYDLYEGRDGLWLTREGNPYQSHSLRYVLKRLCEIADIPTENRQMSWYAIRHSTGTYMTREEDLKAAAAQLRHKSLSSTMRYDQAPLEDRKNALERMR